MIGNPSHRVLVLLSRVGRRRRRAILRTRGKVLELRLRLHGATVGQRLLVDRGVVIRHPPTVRWSIGNEVYIGVGVVLDIDEGATFSVGPRSKIMHYAVIGCSELIAIGADVQIAEMVSVRDAGHAIDTSENMIEARSLTAPVIIEDGVWIGRGCAVLRGVTVGYGAVVGANSVVTRSVESDDIVVGAPAKKLRSRLSPLGVNAGAELSNESNDASLSGAE